MGRNKTQVLRSIRTDYLIAEIPCQDLRSTDIADFARTLRRGERGTATVHVWIEPDGQRPEAVERLSYSGPFGIL